MEEPALSGACVYRMVLVVKEFNRHFNQVAEHVAKINLHSQTLSSHLKDAPEALPGPLTGQCPLTFGVGKVPVF